MNWTAWIASKHALLVHLPIAAALMIPLPVLAAQRAGRGIRPWWTTCRYLAGFGTLGSLLALVTGLALGRTSGQLPPGSWWAPAQPGQPYLFRIHELAGAAALVLGVLCLRALYRKRQEHQGIGLWAMFAGLAWCAAACLGAYTGTILAGKHPAPALLLAPPQPRTAAPAPAPPPAPAPAPLRDPEAQAPVRALDYAALVPLHAEPVRSAPHGNRWIRVWISPGAEQAYRAGQPLPAGTLVVMSSMEDRWGRPGYEPGPLYALEAGADGRSKLTFYWANVPAARRAEAGGEARVYWRGEDAGLQACRACHAQGPAPVKDRSTWVVPRKPKPEAAPAAP